MNRRTAATLTLFAVLFWAACGDMDELGDDDRYPHHQDENPRDEVSEEDSSGGGPMWGTRPANNEKNATHDPANRETAQRWEEPETLEDPEPDEPLLSLDCADDPDVCRFCGPAQGVVTECPPGDPSFPCQVWELVNEERTSRGLHALGYDGTLAESAMIHAMDLSLCDYFAHDSLDGTTFFQRCAANGYGGTCTGENVGGGQSSPVSVVAAWMDSPSHRENLLYPHHTELGVAYFEGDGNFGRYWVKHFGRR